MTKAMAHKTRTKKGNRNSMWIIGGVAAAAVLVLVLTLVNLNAVSAPSKPPSELNAGRVLGQTDAPITIDLYSDFQCPICRRAEALIRQIAPQYVDTGKVRVIYHNFAFIGAESEWAAQAAEGANDQGKFWEYASLLFSHQTGENVGAFAKGNLKQFASDLQLDTAAFNACFDSGKHTALIQQEVGEAQALGVRATPSFYINGRFVQGLLPAAQFTALLDSMMPKP